MHKLPSFLIVYIFSLGTIFADNLILDDNLYHLTQDEQESIVNDLMQQHPYPLSQAKPFLNEDHAAWHELDMNLLIHQLDRTVTTVGKNRFKELMKPIADIDELNLRRSVVQVLLQDKDRYTSLDEFLHDFNEREWLLLTFFEPRNAFYEYLKSQNLSSTKNTDIFNQKIVPSVEVRCTQTIPVAATLFGLYIEWQTLRTILPAWRQGTAGYLVMMHTIAPLLIAPLQLWQAHQAVWPTNAAVRTLHGLMINLATVVNKIKQLDQLMPRTCKAFHKACEQWYDSLTPDSTTYSPELSKLIELLQSSTFTGTPSANIGTNLYELFTAYDYVIQCKDKLLPLLHAYGIADAFMAVTKLYQEHEAGSRPLTWAVWSKDEYPHCSAENVYNPIVAQEKSVVNSFDLGGSYIARHMMLTGPHGCGKTTSMKSIAYLYIMGQSIGLVPATQATIAPLTSIATYLNITDNLAKGMSSFMAEKQRIKELTHLAKNLTTGDCCLMLIDEPYAKTLQVVGEGRVYRFAKELYNIPQLSMLLASHFEKPAILEDETGGIIENYQPELLEPKPGLFIRTFKILKGKAEWWFNNAQRREDFIDWLGEEKI